MTIIGERFNLKIPASESLKVSSNENKTVECF